MIIIEIYKCVCYKKGLLFILYIQWKLYYENRKFPDSSETTVKGCKALDSYKRSFEIY